MADPGKYFVRINDPADVRRTLLETSKSVIVSMQRFERFKERKIEKQKEMQRLKTVAAEIADLSLRLRKILPAVPASLKPKPQRAPKAKVVDVPEPKAQMPVKEQPRARSEVPSELDKLDSELQEIESKLSQLS